MTATGAWTAWYERLGRTEPLAYGDTLTYRLAADFLADCKLVEDWGCGLGFMRTLIESERYRGLDGSASRFVGRARRPRDVPQQRRWGAPAPRP